MPVETQAALGAAGALTAQDGEPAANAVADPEGVADNAPSVVDAAEAAQNSVPAAISESVK